MRALLLACMLALGACGPKPPVKCFDGILYYQRPDKTWVTGSGGMIQLCKEDHAQLPR